MPLITETPFQTDQAILETGLPRLVAELAAEGLQTPDAAETAEAISLMVSTNNGVILQDPTFAKFIKQVEERFPEIFALAMQSKRAAIKNRGSRFRKLTDPSQLQQLSAGATFPARRAAAKEKPPLQAAATETVATLSSRKEAITFLEAMQTKLTSILDQVPEDSEEAKGNKEALRTFLRWLQKFLDKTDRSSDEDIKKGVVEHASFANVILRALGRERDCFTTAGIPEAKPPNSWRLLQGGVLTSPRQAQQIPNPAVDLIVPTTKRASPSILAISRKLLEDHLLKDPQLLHTDALPLETLWNMVEAATNIELLGQDEEGISMFAGHLIEHIQKHPDYTSTDRDRAYEHRSPIVRWAQNQLEYDARNDVNKIWNREKKKIERDLKSPLIQMQKATALELLKFSRLGEIGARRRLEELAQDKTVSEELKKFIVSYAGF